MASVNKVIIVGRLGQDPEVKTTQGGNQVANLSVATSERWVDKQGQQQEKTEWHRVVVWGKTAQLAGQYLQKGSLVYVEGSLETRSYEDSNGVKKYTTEIKGQRVQFLDKAGQSDSKPQENMFDSNSEIPF